MFGPSFLPGCRGHSGLQACQVLHIVRNRVKSFTKWHNTLITKRLNRSMTLSCCLRMLGNPQRTCKTLMFRKGLPHLVERHLKGLIQRFDVNVIPPLFWSSQKTGVVLAAWDLAKMYFPCSQDTILPAEHYCDLCTKTLQTLVKPARVDPQIMIELGRHVPQVPLVIWPQPHHGHRTCSARVTHLRGTSGTP